jgi:ribosomal protein L29
MTPEEVKKLKEKKDDSLYNKFDEKRNDLFESKFK